MNTVTHREKDDHHHCALILWQSKKADYRKYRDCNVGVYCPQLVTTGLTSAKM